MYNLTFEGEYKKPEEVHSRTFNTYKWKPPNLKANELHNKPKDDSKTKKLLERAASRQSSKLKKLKEMGVDLELNDIAVSYDILF